MRFLQKKQATKMTVLASAALFTFSSSLSLEKKKKEEKGEKVLAALTGEGVTRRRVNAVATTACPSQYL